jgi:hypothetical protein
MNFNFLNIGKNNIINENTDFSKLTLDEIDKISSEQIGKMGKDTKKKLFYRLNELLLVNDKNYTPSYGAKLQILASGLDDSDGIDDSYKEYIDRHIGGKRKYKKSKSRKNKIKKFRKTKSKSKSNKHK